MLHAAARAHGARTSGADSRGICAAAASGVSAANAALLSLRRAMTFASLSPACTSVDLRAASVARLLARS